MPNTKGNPSRLSAVSGAWGGVPEPNAVRHQGASKAAAPAKIGHPAKNAVDAAREANAANAVRTSIDAVDQEVSLASAANHHLRCRR
jgi:hypothetical protein